jgi:hypothetical protein
MGQALRIATGIAINNKVLRLNLMAAHATRSNNSKTVHCLSEIPAAIAAVYFDCLMFAAEIVEEKIIACMASWCFTDLEWAAIKRAKRL